MNKVNLSKLVITLVGSAEAITLLHKAYFDLGATAKDSNGVNITSKVITEIW